MAKKPVSRTVLKGSDTGRLSRDRVKAVISDMRTGNSNVAKKNEPAAESSAAPPNTRGAGRSSKR